MSEVLTVCAVVILAMVLACIPAALTTGIAQNERKQKDAETERYVREQVMRLQ